MRKVKLRLGRAGGSAGLFVNDKCDEDASVFPQAKSRGKYERYGRYICLGTRKKMAYHIKDHRFVEVYIPENGETEMEGCLEIRRETGDYWSVMPNGEFLFFCKWSLIATLGLGGPDDVPERLFLKFK